MFVMMEARFLSNLNSYIPFKTWFPDWWITIDHSQTRTSCLPNLVPRVSSLHAPLDVKRRDPGNEVKGFMWDLNKTNCRYPLRYINRPNYPWTSVSVTHRALSKNLLKSPKSLQVTPNCLK